MIRTLLYCVALTALGLLLAAWHWPALPDPMPVHYGPSGEPDGFMSPIWAVMIMPVVTSLLAPLLVLGVTRLDPRQAHAKRNRTAISTIVVALAALGVGLQWLMLSAATSAQPAMSGNTVLILVGLLWVVLGNVLPKLRSNWFAGIRTPWTMQSEKVWHVTHRVGGWCFAIAGMAAVGIAVALPMEMASLTAISVLTGAAIVPYAYSYIAFRNLHPDGDPDGATP